MDLLQIAEALNNGTFNDKPLPLDHWPPVVGDILTVKDISRTRGDDIPSIGEIVSVTYTQSRVRTSCGDKCPYDGDACFRVHSTSGKDDVWSCYSSFEECEEHRVESLMPYD